MTFKKTLATIALYGSVAAAAAAAIPSAARAFSGEEHAAEAKLTLKEARAIALQAFPGTIASEELEKEKGGSGLRYSFDIKNGSRLHEVGVDAKSGRILENSVEHGGD